LSIVLDDVWINNKRDFFNNKYSGDENKMNFDFEQEFPVSSELKNGCLASIQI